MEDEQLMVRYQDGDLRAFEELYRRYGRQIYAFFRRRVNSEEDAADLYQDTFLKLHQDRSTYQTGRRFRTWIFTIARNTLTDFYRTSATRNKVMIPEDSARPTSEIQADGPSPDHALEKVDIRGILEAAIEELPETQRDVLLLRSYDELSYAEIGDILGLAENAARQAMFRAVQSLRVRIKSGDAS